MQKESHLAGFEPSPCPCPCRESNWGLFICFIDHVGKRTSCGPPLENKYTTKSKQKAKKSMFISPPRDIGVFRKS